MWRLNKRACGVYRYDTDEVDLTSYLADRPSGEGVRWNQDRTKAWKLQDGKMPDDKVENCPQPSMRIL